MIDKEARHDQLIEYVQELKLEVPSVDFGKLYVTALAEYKAANSGAQPRKPIEDDPAFPLVLVMHQLVIKMGHYEKEYDKLDGALDDDGACTYLRSRIINAIAEACPYLAYVCSLESMLVGARHIAYDWENRKRRSHTSRRA
jgi:hypothetical protein